MLIWFLAGFFVLLLYLLAKDLTYPLVYRYQARKHSCKSPPVARDFPFGIRSTRSINKAVAEDRLLSKLAEVDNEVAGRTMLRQALFRWVLRTNETENLKAILATQFSDFALERPSMMDAFGSGIFTQNGFSWKHSRAMLRPQFSKEQISRIGTLTHHIDSLINKVKADQQADRVVDMQQYFHLLTMDTATAFLFGESVDSLHFGPDTRGARVTDPKTGSPIMSADFVDSYTWLTMYASYGFRLGKKFWLLKYWWPDYKEHSARAQAFIDHYVHKALVATEGLTAEEKEAADENYVFSHELAKVTRDPVVIRDQLFNILIAGRDTTASTLSYSLYYFAKYPEELVKVRAEIMDLLPEGTPITYENLRKLQYLQYFIKEVLRLAPVVPVNSRTALRNTTLPRGGGNDGAFPLFVPKGTRVVYSVYSVHRDPEIYGPDAQEFKPSRWAPENKLANSPMYSWGYLPFNGGPRICLGQQFALTEIALTLVKLLHEFDTVEPAPGFPFEQRPDRVFLTLQMGGNGVPVRLGRKSDS